jgi:hypothetical protein
MMSSRFQIHNDFGIVSCKIQNVLFDETPATMMINQRLVNYSAAHLISMILIEPYLTPLLEPELLQNLIVTRFS